MSATRTDFVPGKVVRQVTDAGAFLPHQEYLQCREPLTWTRSPERAEVMDYFSEATPLADRLKAAGEPCIFPATVCLPKRSAHEPAMPRGFRQGWRERAKNCGVE